ncbi:MAG: hypothetical protein AAFO95_13650 [Cyanobacteria bacterium J06600_6]
MLNDSALKLSPHGSFKVSQLCKSVAICEATKGDRHNWGNATETEPALHGFAEARSALRRECVCVYLGCKKDEVAEKIRYINNALGCYWCEVRQPKYLKDFEAEIKIRGMQRHSDEETNGLDFLLWAENDFDYVEEDEYSYHTTGYMPHW